MIEFFVTAGHEYTLKALKKSPLHHAVRVRSYDSAFRQRSFQKATVFFLDLDRLSFGDLELAAILYLELKEAGLRVFNDPARVKNRYALLRTLFEAGLNNFNVYLAHDVPKSVRYPVFVRKLQDHSGPLTALLADRAELDQALEKASGSGLPIENLLVVEYAAEPLDDGIYRKLSAFKIGATIWPHSTVHGLDWVVRDGPRVASEARYEEELEATRTNPHLEHLRRVFDLAQIDYGRADFGFYRGRLQIYEINTNPCVHFPISHRYASRRESMQVNWQKFLDALGEMNSQGVGRIHLTKRTSKLKRYRKWKSMFNRTRTVD